MRNIMSTFSKSEAEELVSLFKSELGLEVPKEEACQHVAQLIDLLRATYREGDDEATQAPP